jgi:heptaprenyl diphosphate synthase
MESGKPRSESPARKMALSAALLSATFALSSLEHMLPPLPFFPPGVRLGLGNIALMYSLFFVSVPNAFGLCALKAAFVFISRGATAGMMSMAGGMASLAGMAAALALFGKKASYLFMSVLGATLHNAAQMALASALAGTNLMLAYLPHIALSGILFGTATCASLKAAMPHLSRIRNGGKP